MKDEANAAGIYQHLIMGRDESRIQIVTVGDIVVDQKRLQVPMSLEVLKNAKAAADVE